MRRKQTRSCRKKIHGGILAKIFPRHHRGRRTQQESLRKQAFALFQKGLRPAQVSQMVPMSMRTCLRYFEDHKKMNHLVSYTTIRRWLKRNPVISERVVAMIADRLGMSQEEVNIRMMKPWALLQAMEGKWPDHKIEEQRGEMEGRLEAALEVVLFAERFGGKDPDEVKAILTKIMIDKEQAKQSSPNGGED